jgi:hypothetical protein
MKLTCSTHGEMRCYYGALAANPQGKSLCSRPSRRWAILNKRCLTEWTGVNLLKTDWRCQELTAVIMGCCGLLGRVVS